MGYLAFAVGLIIGIFLGTFIGVCAMSLLIANRGSRSNRLMENPHPHIDEPGGLASADKT
jgi:gas vesicle protein